MIISTPDLSSEQSLSADVCIVGGGVAGLVMAHRLIASGLRVLLLEAGASQWSEDSQSLYQAEVVGCAYKGHMEGRFRVLGGSSTRWGGQLLPLEPADFAAWPIGLEHVRPYYQVAESIMRVNALPFDEAIWSTLGLKPAAFDARYFQYRYSKWARFQHRNLAETIGKACAKARNVTLLLNAPVTHLQLNREGSAVSSVTVTSPSGMTHEITARHVVLACGTLEVARLLLSSNDVHTAGIGNQHDWVGRYFQDHISYRAAELRPTNLKKFAQSFAPNFIRRIMHFPRLQLTSTAQTEWNCLGVFGHVQFHSPEDSCFAMMRDILRRLQAERKFSIRKHEIANIVRSLPYFARLSYSHYVKGQVPYPPGSRWYLQVDVEQEARPDSRVFLSDERDALGLRKLSIDWRVGERERQSAATFIAQLKQEWPKHALSEVIWNPAIDQPDHTWLSHSEDTYHQAGTTRMSASPTQGVVDENLRVHGVNNLHIASCSVFPTSGSANPTFTLMALSLRLADYLKQLFDPGAPAKRAQQSTPLTLR